MITVNGEKMDWEEGMTIQDLLNKMNFSFPMLVISVNGEIVLRGKWGKYEIPKDADVKVIHMMAGG